MSWRQIALPRERPRRPCRLRTTRPKRLRTTRPKRASTTWRRRTTARWLSASLAPRAWALSRQRELLRITPGLEASACKPGSAALGMITSSPSEPRAKPGQPPPVHEAQDLTPQLPPCPLDVSEGDGSSFARVERRRRVLDRRDRAVRALGRERPLRPGCPSAGGRRRRSAQLRVVGLPGRPQRRDDLERLVSALSGRPIRHLFHQRRHQRPGPESERAVDPRRRPELRVLVRGRHPDPDSHQRPVAPSGGTLNSALNAYGFVGLGSTGYGMTWANLGT